MSRKSDVDYLFWFSYQTLGVFACEYFDINALCFKWLQHWLKHLSWHRDFYTLLFCCTQNTRWWSTCITKRSWSAAEKLKEAPAPCGTLLSCLTSLQEKSVSCESCLSLSSCRWKNFGVSRSENISTCSYIVLTLWILFLCYRARPFPKAKFWVVSGLVQRLQMLDELTGGMCATCRWSKRAGTRCSQSLCRAVTKTSQTDSWQWPYLKANILSKNANKNGDYQIEFQNRKALLLKGRPFTFYLACFYLKVKNLLPKCWLSSHIFPCLFS